MFDSSKFMFRNPEIGTVGKLAITCALIGAIYGEVFLLMMSHWLTLTDYSYGLTVPVLAAGIAWCQRNKVERAPEFPDWRGPIVTTIACLMFLFGALSSELFFTRTSFVVLLAGLILTFWGPHRLRTLFLPLLLLATMVPLPLIVFNLTSSIQSALVGIGTSLAEAAGVVVNRDDGTVRVAAASIEVGKAAGALRTVPSLFVFALALGGSGVMCALRAMLGAGLAVGAVIVRTAVVLIWLDRSPEDANAAAWLFSGWLTLALLAAAVWLTRGRER